LKTELSAIKQQYRRSHFDEPELLRKIVKDTIHKHHGRSGTTQCDSDGNPCTPDSVHSDDDNVNAAHDVPMSAEQVHWGRSDDADGSKIYHYTKDHQLVDMQGRNSNQLDDAYSDCDVDDDDVLIQYTEKGWHRQMMIDAPRDIMMDGDMLLQKASVSVSNSAQTRKTSKKRKNRKHGNIYMDNSVHENGNKQDFCLFEGDRVYKSKKRGKYKNNRKTVHCMQSHRENVKVASAYSDSNHIQVLSQQQSDCLQARQIRELIDSKMHAYTQYAANQSHS